MASLSSLEAERNRLQRINNELRAELGAIINCTGNAYSRMQRSNNNAVNGLNASAQRLEDSTRKSLAAIETQLEIDDLYTRFKKMELANKKIRECNNKKYYDFAVFRSVRKLVQALMDNLDLNLVSNKVIYKSIEKNHLKHPNYWLTCALIAVMAWRNDDKSLADRAIEIALKLDKKSSAVFFMLFNLRMQRDKAALKWFLLYKDCELKGSDQRVFLLLFALMSRNINGSENMNEDTRTEIKSFINKIIEDNVCDADYDEDAVVDRAVYFYDRMDAREITAYPILASHCKNYAVLEKSLSKAKGNIAILELIKQIMHTDSVKKNEFVKNFIDELINEVNSEETEIYDEIHYNELIIRYRGDDEKAKEIYDSEKIHDENKLNLIAEMVEWIFTADEDELDSEGRMGMFALTGNIQKKAIEKRTESYRSINKKNLDIEIDNYSSNADFGNIEAEKGKIRDFYNNIAAQEKAQVKNLIAYISFGVGVAAGIAAIVTQAWGLFAVTAIGAIFGGIVLFVNANKKKNIDAVCKSNIEGTTGVLNSMFEEYKAYMEEYNIFDAYVSEINSELEGIK